MNGWIMRGWMTFCFVISSDNADYLASRSIRDIKRERILEALNRYDWHIFSTSQELGTKARVLYSQMKRLGIQPARKSKNNKRGVTRNLGTTTSPSRESVPG